MMVDSCHFPSNFLGSPNPMNDWWILVRLISWSIVSKTIWLPNGCLSLSLTVPSHQFTIFNHQFRIISIQSHSPFLIINHHQGTKIDQQPSRFASPYHCCLCGIQGEKTAIGTGTRHLKQIGLAAAASFAKNVWPPWTMEKNDWDRDKGSYSYHARMNAIIDHYLYYGWWFSLLSSFTVDH